MPSRAPRICSLHRVAYLTSCRACDAARWAEQDRRRETSNARGYGEGWPRVRRLALERDDYLCQDCRREGRNNLATEVDHVEPIDKRPDLRLALGNLRSLCHAHHVAKTRRDKQHAAT